MIEQIEHLITEVEAFNTTSRDELESFRVKYLSKKGILNGFFSDFRHVSSDQKKVLGKSINTLKHLVEGKIASLQEAFEKEECLLKDSSHNDLSKPGKVLTIGSRHPISIVKNQITDIFSHIGFNVSEGPEIEDDWHNFTALNLPEHHPARDMQDTFFVQTNPDVLLRTHTSSVQVRYMENNTLPIRTISPGRVYRNEAISARSHCFFHQIEGLYIDKCVSFSDLKQTLEYFTSEMFGKSKIRLRPSFFPFTEPSAEIDVYWGLKTEMDYKITKGTGWLEIGGCGMIDPSVLKNCNIDPNTYSGFAFGVGVDRIAMLLYQIGDIRLFSENNLNFIKQFKAVL